MTYKEVLAHLDALQMHKIKLGLEAMQSFLERVERPESRLKFVMLQEQTAKVLSVPRSPRYLAGQATGLECIPLPI
jgi:hypothetical protein